MVDEETLKEKVADFLSINNLNSGETLSDEDVMREAIIKYL